MRLNSIYSKIRYNNTVRKKKLKEIPNKETIKALNEYEAMKSNANNEYKTYESFAEMLKDLDA